MTLLWPCWAQNGIQCIESLVFSTHGPVVAEGGHPIAPAESDGLRSCVWDERTCKNGIWWNKAHDDACYHSKDGAGVNNLRHDCCLCRSFSKKIHREACHSARFSKMFTIVSRTCFKFGHQNWWPLDGDMPAIDRAARRHGQPRLLAAIRSRRAHWPNVGNAVPLVGETLPMENMKEQFVPATGRWDLVFSKDPFSTGGF